MELLTRFELVTRFAPKILRIFGDPGEIGHYVLELLTRFELVTRFAPKILRIFGDPGEIGHGGSVPLRLHAAPKPRKDSVAA